MKFIAMLYILGTAIFIQSSPAKTNDADVCIQAVSADEGGAWLGVQIKDLTRRLRKELDTKARFGVVVDNVLDDSPAADAGLEPGDVIVKFDGKNVRRVKDLTRAMKKKNPDEEVPLEVMRGNEREKIVVTLGERPKNQVWFSDEPGFRFEKTPSAFLGIEVHEMDKNLARYFNVDANKGLLVTAVEKDSPADKGGIESGDVITSMDNKDIQNIDDFSNVLQEYGKGDRVKIGYIRKGEDYTTTVVLESNPYKFNYFKNFHFSPNLRTTPFLAPQLRKQYKEDLQRYRKELDEWRNEYRQETKEKIEREIERAMEKKERELKQMKDELEKMKKEVAK
ncbi:MAG: PDZ domain-containing protein, partial [Actinobacteria bacterium]|nr:PDZ domain-containing protein [Actinomycetota bacterium]